MTSNFPAILESRQQVVQSAIPAGVPVSAQRIITGALIAWNGSAKLQECDPGSLVTCVVKAAQLGLDPSGSLGEAYLVPFQGKATLIVGYQGMIAIARRSGVVRSIRAHAVGEHDDFDYELGLDPALRHKPSRGERGAFVAAYAVAELTEGDKQFEVMFKAEIDLIRARSRASKDGPWVTDYPEMAKKTVIRRLFKYLPKSVQLMAALEHDNETAGLDTTIHVAPAAAPAQTAREVVRARLAEPAPVVAVRPTVAETVATSGAAPPPEPAADERDPELVAAHDRLLLLGRQDQAACEAVGLTTLRGVRRMAIGTAQDWIRRIEAQIAARTGATADAPDVEPDPGPQDDTDTEEPDTDVALPF